MIPDFNLRDLESFLKHEHYGRKRNGEDSSKSLAFLGAVTIAIGAKMVWDGVGKDWATRVCASRTHKTQSR